MSKRKPSKEPEVKISLPLDVDGFEIKIDAHAMVHVTMSRSYAAALARRIDHELTNLDPNTRRFYNSVGTEK